jgi:hypothetical protein
MKVIHKRTHEIYTVYGSINTLFLMYINGGWSWVEQKYWIPYEETLIYPEPSVTHTVAYTGDII